MPNAKLAEYFDSKHINLDVDFGKLEEKDTEKYLMPFLNYPKNNKPP
jgi:hypothetical protein